MNTNTLWFVIAGLLAGGVAILTAIAVANGMRLPAGRGVTIPDWLKSKKFLIGAFALVGLLVLYFGVLTSTWGTPEFGRVGAVALGRWFWLIVIGGIVVAIVTISATKKKEAVKTAGWVLGIVALLLFVVAPIAGWWNQPPQAPKQASGASAPQATIPLASQPKSKWEPLKMEPGVGSKSAHVLAVSGMRVAMHGEDFRYHCVYKESDVEREVSFLPGETPCPDNDSMLYYYASNLRATNSNIVLYAYAPEK